MRLTSPSFTESGPIPAKFAFTRPAEVDHVEFADNMNPALAWAGAPDETRSYALICHDGDVPSKGDDVNQEDREVPADLSRVDFYHWVLVDIPPDVTALGEGEYSEGVVARGKKDGETANGARQGINDYTGWFGADPDMSGDYYGYDGPCPPWNDTIVHHYVFTVYALDTDHLDVSGPFTAQEAIQAMDGHILAEASIMGTYNQNPGLVV